MNRMAATVVITPPTSPVRVRVTWARNSLIAFIETTSAFQGGCEKREPLLAAGRFREAHCVLDDRIDLFRLQLLLVRRHLVLALAHDVLGLFLGPARRLGAPEVHPLGVDLEDLGLGLVALAIGAVTALAEAVIRLRAAVGPGG